MTLIQENSSKMVNKASNLTVRLAMTADDVRAAQALRYDVFVTELGADGPMVDHDAGLERDPFDQHADQLLLLDGDKVVGVYRLMDGAAAQAAGSFYSQREYDLGPLLASGRPLLELGRSCLHRDYRGGCGSLGVVAGVGGYCAGPPR